MFEVEEKIKNIFKKGIRTKYAKKEIIINAQEEYQSLHYIEKGVVRSYYADENGTEFTINLLKPGAIFPLSAYLSDFQNNFDYEVFTEAVIIKMPKRKVSELIFADNLISSYFLQKFAAGLEGYVIRSQFLIKGSALQKVASSLLLLMNRFGINKAGIFSINLPLTHQDIAGLSGITRETATICINDLERQKIILRKGKFIRILNDKKLKENAKMSDNGTNISFAN